MPLTPTEALLDVNVLIAMVFEDHSHHATARAFTQRLDRFYTTPTTQGGFLRFATRPWRNENKEDQPPRLSMTVAFRVLGEISDSTGHRFIPDDESFAEMERPPVQGHRQWTDAYLLHLARKRGLAFASLESRMSNLDDPSQPVLFVVK